MTEYMIVDDSDVLPRDGTIKLHGPAGFQGMRKAGRLAAEILDALAPLVEPGVTPASLDDVVRRMTLDGGAVPATLGYRGYTHSCCISINHVVCHGIPSEKTLKDGDIVNIDVTPLLDGWHGDSSRMYLVGDVPLKARRLVDVTYECLMIGIEQALRDGQVHLVIALGIGAGFVWPDQHAQPIEGLMVGGAQDQRRFGGIEAGVEFVAALAVDLCGALGCALAIERVAEGHADRGGKCRLG